MCHRADEVIRIGALDALASGQVKKFRRQLEVCGIQGQIGKGGEIFFERGELLFRFDPGKEFLPDRADQLHPQFGHQLGEFLDQGAFGGLVVA